MKEVRPRLAIAYHFFNDPGTAPDVYKEILDVYDSPVSLAKDLMVWNITPEDIQVRQLINTRDTWPKPEEDPKPGTRGESYGMSDWIKDGEVKFEGVDEYPDVPVL